MFSCEFYKVFKNTFFTEHLWATDSVNLYIVCIKETGKVRMCYVCFFNRNLFHSIIRMLSRSNLSLLSNNPNLFFPESCDWELYLNFQSSNSKRLYQFSFKYFLSNVRDYQIEKRNIFLPFL